MTTTTYASIFQTLLAQVNEAHVRFPQYAGHWDDWDVAVALRDVKHRGVTVLRKGDHVLYNPRSISLGWLGSPAPKVTVYLACNGVDTVIKAVDIATVECAW